MTIIMLIMGGWIVKWVASSGGVPKGPGSIPGGAKVLDTDGIYKYLPVSVSVCLCLLCSVCINQLIYDIVANLGAGL